MHLNYDYYRFRPTKTIMPLKIRIQENTNTESTPIRKANGLKGCKKPVNGTLIKANPAKIHDKNKSGYLSIESPPFQTNLCTCTFIHY